MIKHKEVHVNWGQSVHLPCKFNGFIQETQDLQQLLAAQQRQSNMMNSMQQQQQQQRNNYLSPGGGGGGGGMQLTTATNTNGNNQMMMMNQAAAMAAAATISDAYIQQTASQAFQAQPHGMLQPSSYIQWYYHRRDNVHSAGFPVLQRRDKFILAADQGLVIMNANEPGWYQCRLGNQIIQSYNLIIDTSEYLLSYYFLVTLFNW